MKKVAMLLLAAFVLGVVMTACRSSQSCPAYGDYRQYQKESVY